MVLFTSKLLVVSSILALSTVAALPAHADDESKTIPSSFANFESLKTRDQVREEYMQSKKKDSSEFSYEADTPVLAKAATSNISRTDVVAETVEWLRTKSTSVGMGD
jgi:hypothetical protein